MRTAFLGWGWGIGLGEDMSYTFGWLAKSEAVGLDHCIQPLATLDQGRLWQKPVPALTVSYRGQFHRQQLQVVTYLLGTLSPVNHKGLHQG